MRVTSRGALRWAMFGIALLCGSALQAATGGTAVLPFTNQSPQANANDWIGESIAEALREALTVSGVPVIPREEIAQAYTRLRLRPGVELTQASILKIGQTVNAERVIAGTFRADSVGALTIATTLSDRTRARITGPFIESGLVSGIDVVEGHLAWQMVRIITPLAAPPETSFALLRPPVRAAAEESFIRGMLSATTAQKERYYQQAARSDPRFGRPLLELGRIDMERRSYKSAAAWLSKVEPTDMHYAEASFYLGAATFHAGDYVSAQGAFDRIANTIDTAETFNNLGAAQSRLSMPRALESFRKAIELDPSQADYHFNLGFALFKSGQFDAAADMFRAVLERNPSDQVATLLLGRCIKREGLRAGNPADARFQTAERFKDTYRKQVNGYNR